MARPLLLLLVSMGKEHNGATLTIEYRAFQAATVAPTGITSLPEDTPFRIAPVQMVVENLGNGHKGGMTYSFAAPVQHLWTSTPFGAALSGPLGGSPQQQAQQQRGLEETAEAAARQVAAVESSCDALLRQLKGLCQKVGFS